MQIPAYWMRRPEPGPDSATIASFDRLLDQALERGAGEPIDYRLDAPKWQFLSHAADRGDVVLHGSGDPGIARFEPRQPDDPLEFSNRNAVFAATEGIWPLYYAILDRATHPMLMVNATVRVGGDGQLSGPYYFFSISDQALRHRPYRSGTVYLLPAATFENQPPIEADGVFIHVAQAASAEPVTPAAKLTVYPEDFPFLEHIRGHDDAALSARMAADPTGFPWLETD